MSDILLEKIETLYEGKFDYFSFTDTLSQMFEFRQSFASIQDIEGEQHSALRFYQILVALQKEVGLKRNEFVNELKKQARNDSKKYLVASQNTASEAFSQFKTSADRMKYLKIKDEEFEDSYKKVDADFKTIVDFISEQIWMIKRYMDMLADRRLEFVALYKHENNY